MFTFARILFLNSLIFECLDILFSLCFIALVALMDPFSPCTPFNNYMCSNTKVLCVYQACHYIIVHDLKKLHAFFTLYSTNDYYLNPMYWLGFHSDVISTIIANQHINILINMIFMPTRHDNHLH